MASRHNNRVICEYGDHGLTTALETEKRPRQIEMVLAKAGNR